MGVWDINTPVGTDAKSTIDDRIREHKTAEQEFLRAGADSGDEAVFPGAAPTTAPIYRYRGLKGTTAQRPASGEGGLYFDTTRMALQRDNSSSWEDVGTPIPAATNMLFPQSSVPTGWTKREDVDGKAVRIISGGNGGTVATGTDLASGLTLRHSHVVDDHNHSMANHTHSIPQLRLADQAGEVINPQFTSFIGSTDENNAELRVVIEGDNSAVGYQDIKNWTIAGTSGVPSDNLTGGRSPNTSGELTDIASFAYMNCLIGTKD